MKKVSLLVIVSCFVALVKAQTSNDALKIMIDSAIKIKYNRYQQAKKNLSKDYLENLYLINEQNQALDYLPSSNKFKPINIYDHRNKKILSKGIYAWKVFTKINGNKFIVTIIDFYITYKKNNYDFGNGGGSTIVFNYNCEKAKWNLVSSETKGN